MLNVTVDRTYDIPSFMTVWPKGVAQPTASNLNFVTGQTVANMVIVPVGADGRFRCSTPIGHAHTIVDVLGWFPAE